MWLGAVGGCKYGCMHGGLSTLGVCVCTLVLTNLCCLQEGCSPLYAAAFNGHVEVARILLAAGAEPSVRVGAGAEPSVRVGGPATMHDLSESHPTC